VWLFWILFDKAKCKTCTAGYVSQIFDFRKDLLFILGVFFVCCPSDACKTDAGE